MDARTLWLGGEVTPAPGVITLPVSLPSRASARPGRGISSATAISGMSATIRQPVYQMAPVRLAPRLRKTAVSQGSAEPTLLHYQP